MTSDSAQAGVFACGKWSTMTADLPAIMIISDANLVNTNMDQHQPGIIANRIQQWLSWEKGFFSSPFP